MNKIDINHRDDIACKLLIELRRQLNAKQGTLTEAIIQGSRQN
jgi:hypothetical protein